MVGQESHSAKVARVLLKQLGIDDLARLDAGQVSEVELRD